jgi:hypothetical protein
MIPKDQAYGWADKAKGRTCSEKRLSAGLEMGGLGIPHSEGVIQGFPQNFIRKFASQLNLNANLCWIMNGLGREQIGHRWQCTYRD